MSSCSSEIPDPRASSLLAGPEAFPAGGGRKFGYAFGMRRSMMLELGRPGPGHALPEGLSLRAPTRADRDVLAELMLDAYQGTIDDEGESIEDARSEVDQFLDGHYGEPMLELSAVACLDGTLASAALLTRLKGAPFLAFSMTAAVHKRNGYARACLEHLIDALRSAGHATLALEVTGGNGPAERMYEEIGFTDA